MSLTPAQNVALTSLVGPSVQGANTSAYDPGCVSAVDAWGSRCYRAYQTNNATYLGNPAMDIVDLDTGAFETFIYEGGNPSGTVMTLLLFPLRAYLFGTTGVMIFDRKQKTWFQPPPLSSTFSNFMDSRVIGSSTFLINSVGPGTLYRITTENQVYTAIMSNDPSAIPSAQLSQYGGHGFQVGEIGGGYVVAYTAGPNSNTTANLQLYLLDDNGIVLVNSYNFTLPVGGQSDITSVWIGYGFDGPKLFVAGSSEGGNGDWSGGVYEYELVLTNGLLVAPVLKRTLIREFIALNEQSVTNTITCYGGSVHGGIVVLPTITGYFIFVGYVASAGFGGSICLFMTENSYYRLQLNIGMYAQQYVLLRGSRFIIIGGVGQIEQVVMTALLSTGPLTPMSNYTWPSPGATLMKLDNIEKAMYSLRNAERLQKMLTFMGLQ